jgi:3-hydroxymyristoyl/3-hydroxydecanoyl-(acyl carrier protein) dehydratase
MTVALTLTIGADHPALAGHFPGAPIVPGVLLLDEIVSTVAIADAHQWRIGAAKFLHPVRPGETLTLAYERLANGSIRFSILRDGEAVAHGRLVQLSPSAASVPHEQRAD